MRTISVSLFRLEATVRWTARVLAVVLVGVILVMFIGVGGVYPVKLQGTELIQMVFLWTACIGILLAWHWQVIGGTISLVGMLLFFTVEFVARGGLPRGLFPYLMLLPGILFMVSSVLTRRMYAKAWSLFDSSRRT